MRRLCSDGYASAWLRINEALRDALQSIGLYRVSTLPKAFHRTPITGGAPFRGVWVPEKSAFATRMHASKKRNAAPPEFSGTQPPLEAQENLQKPKKKGNQYKIKEKQKKYIQKQLEKREGPGGDKRRTSGEQGHEQSTAPLSFIIVFVCISFVFL